MEWMLFSTGSGGGLVPTVQHSPRDDPSSVTAPAAHGLAVLDFAGLTCSAVLAMAVFAPVQRCLPCFSGACPVQRCLPWRSFIVQLGWGRRSFIAQWAVAAGALVGTDSGGGLLARADGAALLGTESGGGLLATDDGAALLGTDSGGGLLASDDGAALLGTDSGGGLLASDDGAAGGLLGSGDDGGLLRRAALPRLWQFLLPLPHLGRSHS
ncbi:hypothetical protein NDU88_004044 [Pleurodeles waltl]|uniref:Uncharacterized protein n=1 Tax=Pleurodeles waltl TaxID=8319 RepID=A0AAV7QAQ7_PLEWA|nr:hypothetical protein NDU88_004044 [Pleurodeles waltl]